MLQSYSRIRSTIIRTAILWLFGNLGGTLILGLCLSLNRLDDCTLALGAGLIAAIISLPLVPLGIPFFAVLGKTCRSWSRRSIALLGVVLFFLLANELLRFFLPFLTWSSLLELAVPYLIAALGTVFWLYSPHGQLRTSRRYWAVLLARNSRMDSALRMFKRETTPPAI